MNKRAQSQIITTVLIILLVLAAIIIVWQVVSSTIESGSQDIVTKVNCIDVNLDIVEAEATTQTVKITRRSGGKDSDVSNIKILVNGAAVTPSSTTGDYAFTLLETETITLPAATITAGDTVEVAAVLSDTTVCDISGTKTAIV